MNWLELILKTLPQLVAILPQLLAAIATIAQAFNGLPVEHQKAITQAVKTVIAHTKEA